MESKDEFKNIIKNRACINLLDEKSYKNLLIYDIS